MTKARKSSDQVLNTYSGSEEPAVPPPGPSTMDVAVPEGSGAPVGGRAREAKLCNNRAKVSLNSARNLRTDIKQTVTKEIERLYQLVKEAEAVIEGMQSGKKATAGVEREVVRRVTVESQEKDWAGLEEFENRIIAKIEESTHLLIQENKDRMDRLIARDDKEMDEAATAYYKLCRAVESSTRVTAATAELVQYGKPEPKTLYSVVVSSTDEMDTADKVLEGIKESMDAKEGWVKVEKIRKAKDKKIIMGCRTIDERQKIKERLEQEGGRFVVEDIRNKDPLLILKGVLKEHSDEELLRALRNQNEGLFEGLDDEESRVAIRYKKRARDSNCHHVVISVAPRVWTRATEARRLYIDLQRVVVEDQSPLVQCTRCLGYGHGKKYCTSEVTADLCMNCGEHPHYKDEECPRENFRPCCINCYRATNKKEYHNAFDTHCPVRMKWDAVARASVAYS